MPYNRRRRSQEDFLMRMMKRSVCLVSAFLLCSAYALPSAAVEVGEKAPDFELPSTQSGKFKLSEQAGKKNVVIQFYVLDFTPT
jgi:peroxiredoxin